MEEGDRFYKYKSDYTLVLKRGDTMRAKIIMALLAMLAVGFSVAPSWVKPGVNLNYSVGTDSVSFTVLDRTGSSIQIEMYTQSTTKKTHPNEDPTGVSGQFWFDSSSLQYAYPGDLISGYTVSAMGSQTFAGQTWDTVTLQSTISGATTTKVLDMDSGLLLKQTVNAVGAPQVTLQQFYVPDWVQAPAAPPANNTAPPPANNTANATATPPQNSTPTAPPPVAPPAQNNTPPAQVTAPAPAAAANTAATDQTSSCCPSAFILLALAFVAFMNKA